MHCSARSGVAPLLLAACLQAQAPTANWSQFLGDDVSALGHGAHTLSFDRERDQLYRVAVPPGESSPCVVGDRIFLTAVEDKQLLMLALDRRTGAELWRHSVPGPESYDFSHSDSGVAMTTPCSNGERVFFYLPSYGLVARRMDGELAWELRLKDPAASFGIGSSPRLHGDTLYLLRDGCPERRLYALDEETGEERWSVPRLRFADSHTTPFIWKNREQTELIIASTGTVTSFDPEDGAELWRVQGLTPLVCTTPTASEDRLYFAGWSTPSAAGSDRFMDGMEEDVEFTDEELKDPRLLFAKIDANGDDEIEPAELPKGRARDSFVFLDRDRSGGIELKEWLPLMRMPVMGKNLLISIRPGGDGNITKSHVEWQWRRGVPYVSSPLLVDGRVYMVKAGGILSCIDAETGKPRFRQHRLGDRSEYYATPVGVDGHVVICASGGTVYVLEVADEVKIVHEVDFGERIFATPAIAQGCVYLRTHDALYAFGRRDDGG